MQKEPLRAIKISFFQILDLSSNESHASKLRFPLLKISETNFGAVPKASTACSKINGINR